MSEHDPKQDTDLETLLAFRLSSERAKFWRDALRLFGFLIAMGIGLLIMAAVQYHFCQKTYPDITPMQCFRAEKMGKRK